MATLQFKVRLDEALHAAIKRAADENSRSVNAEIVRRLEESIFREQPPTEILPAEKARELVKQAQKHLPSEIFAKVIAGINRGVALGHNFIMVDLSEFELEIMEEDKSALIVEMLERSFVSAGYKVSWDGLEYIMIDF